MNLDDDIVDQDWLHNKKERGDFSSKERSIKFQWMKLKIKKILEKEENLRSIVNLIKIWSK